MNLHKRERARRKLSDNLLFLLVIPVVAGLIVGFFLITRNIIPDISKDKMSLVAEICEEDMVKWSEQIISELNIYKSIAENEGNLSEHTVGMLSTSYGASEGYPFGLYWGDENGGFYDTCGWDPGPEYIPASRIWFTEGLEHTESFEFGEPYIDARTGKPAVTATFKVPFTEVTTIFAADVYFDYVTRLVEDIVQGDVGRAFVVSNKNGLIIASSDWNAAGMTFEELPDSEQQSDARLYGNIKELLDSGFTGMTKVSGAEKYYVDIRGIEQLDWSLITCMKSSDMTASLTRLDIIIFAVGVVMSVILIILTNRASEKLNDAAHKAKTDPLTGLLNRDGFGSAAKASFKKGSEGVLLLFDVDNFKRVNDELGHPVGDRFLKELSELLSEYFNRNSDVCARLGGDEFAVYVGRKLEKDVLRKMLEKFISQFHDTFDGKYRGQKLSVSIGAAFSEKDGRYDDVYKSSDKALYDAKEGGKDRFVIAD